MPRKSPRHGHAAAISALLASFVPALSQGLVTTSVLQNFEDGSVGGAIAATTGNSSTGGATNSIATNVDETGSLRLRMTDPDGSYNGLVMTMTGVFSEPGNYIITADVKVNNSASIIDSFGMAGVVGGPTTTKVSDVNAGYVMNLPQNTTTAAALGYQTIGCAVQVPAGGTFPKNLTLYFGTDPSRGNFASLPANDGNFNGGHRSLATTWTSSANAVYIDNIKKIGPGNYGEERHFWISIGDNYTNLTNLNSQIQSAKNNGFNAVDILARYRTNRYYRANRDYSTYSNPEPFGSGASNSNDPIQAAIDKCHELGMRAYVSWSCFLATDSSTYPGILPAGSITYTYNNSGLPVPQTNNGEGLWADVGRADVRAHVINVLMDFVQNYDIDGVIFDRIRYDSSSYGYNPVALQEMGYAVHNPFQAGDPIPSTSNAAFRDRRREAVTTFLHDAYVSVTNLKPWIVVGTVPIAYGDGLNDTYNSVFQSWPKWSSIPTENRVISFGAEDLIQPQFYRLASSSGSNQAPAANQRLMQKAAFGDVAAFNLDYGLMPGSNVMIAPLFYHPNSGDSAQSAANAQNICDTRQLAYPMNGWGLYAATRTLTDISLIRNSSTTSCGTDVMALTVPLPDFLMKENYDNTPPNGITDLSSDNNTADVITLSWSTPSPAADGEIPTRYLIYRSTTTPVRQYYANLVNRNYVVSGSTFADSTSTGMVSGNSYYYLVVAVDDYNNKATSNQIGPVIYSTPGEYIIETRNGGKNVADYSEISGDWANSTSKSTAPGTTQGIGSRYSTMTTRNDVARFSPSGITPGTNTFDIFYTSNNAASTNAPNTTWRVNTSAGIVTGTFNAVSPTTGNVWHKLGQFSLTTGSGYVEIDSSSTTTTTGSDRLPADAMRFVQIGGSTPSPSPTQSPTPSPSPTASPSPSPTASPTPSPSPSTTPSISPTALPSPDAKQGFILSAVR
ncbi:family 10 glycosylhydrolase [Candidatus Sumerlaeota bacterium]|nr:family 10 glycosylhydrolase [Candidatus Sumerlaeota bacterium]